MLTIQYYVNTSNNVTNHKLKHMFYFVFRELELDNLEYLNIYYAGAKENW